MIRWEKFSLENVFGSPIRGTRLTKEARVPGQIPLVTAGFNSEGVAEFISNPEQQTFHGGMTIDMFGNCFFRDYDFKADDNILIFDKKDVSSETKLFIVTCVNKAIKGLFDYGCQFRQKTYSKTSISLPILLSSTNEPIIDETCQYHKDGYIPDWKYMQERIKELEQERIKELEQYLIVTGLNDYELTEEDKEVLNTKLVEGGQSQSSTSGNGCLKGQWDPHCKEAREFRIGDMFKKIKTDKIRGKANDFPTSKDEENTIPLLTAGIENQGLARFAPKEKCPTILNNVITISANGANTGITYYQDEDFSVLQDAYAIKLVNEDIPNRFIGLYLTSCIKKSIYGIYSWSNKAGWPRVQKVNISLPIQTDSSHHPVIDPTHKYHPEGYMPDWDYMEKYIRAMEKVVIKDAVIWKDEMIEKTKMVVNGD